MNEPHNTDDDWAPPNKRLWVHRWGLGALVVAILLGWAYLLKLPVAIIYKVTSGHLERSSMKPKEILLGASPEERKRTRVDYSDSSLAKLVVPNRFIRPGFDYTNLYQSSIDIKTTAETVGQDVVDKIYGINKAEWTLKDYSPPVFTLYGHHSSTRNMAGRIKAFEDTAISTRGDEMFKIIATTRSYYNKQRLAKASTPESLIYIPHEAEQEGNLYIECSYQYKNMLCRMKDKIDQKITVESLIDRRQLANWKLLREATRRFVLHYYLNP